MGTVWVIVVAAGSGSRFGGPKQYEPLAGRRVLDWSIEAARTVADGIVVVMAPEHAPRTQRGVDAVVAGGAPPPASVRAGRGAGPARGGGLRGPRLARQREDHTPGGPRCRGGAGPAPGGAPVSERGTDGGAAVAPEAAGPAIRVGQGFDVHAFSPEPDRPLILGGVRFEGEPGLAGHSDADVIAHAVTDALLGAAGLGDIGQHFPDTDPALAGADSLGPLERAGAEVRAGGWQPQKN